MPYPSILDLRNFAKKYVFEDLQRKKLLSEGKVNPWDLPEYQNMTQGIRAATDRGLESLSSSLTRGGVTGPAAALAEERVVEGGNDNILNLADTMRTGMRAEGDAGAVRAQNLYNTTQQALAQKAMQPSSGESGLDKAGKIVGLVNSVAMAPLQGLQMAKSAGPSEPQCCFIFRAGNDGVLEDPVRIFRDKYFAPDSNVSVGYKKMAKYLVPWMEKSRMVKKIVKALMLDPLARVARWDKGSDRLGWLFIPIGVFWCFIWGETGKVRRDLLHSASV